MIFDITKFKRTKKAGEYTPAPRFGKPFYAVTGMSSDGRALHYVTADPMEVCRFMAANDELTRESLFKEENYHKMVKYLSKMVPEEMQ